jgi:uncharacterized membrane protein YdbT with pleckstrin-like domain
MTMKTSQNKQVISQNVQKTPDKNFINLLKDEKIIQEIRPLPKLKWLWFLQSFVFILLFFFIFGGSFFFGGGLAALILTKNPLVGLIFGILCFIFFLIILIAIPLIVIFVRYNWEKYWITNKRIIRRAGFIGHNFYSVPLERISDVMISRSLWEKIFGIGSLHIQTLAGQASYGAMGTETALLALPNPEETQKLIMELVEAKRKREKLSF